MAIEVPGYQNALGNLHRAVTDEEKRQRDEEAAAREQERKAELRKKQELSNSLSFRVSMLILGLKPSPINWPHEGSGNWESSWQTIAETEDGTLMAQLGQSWSAGQVRGNMNAYDYFSYHHKSYTHRVQIKIISEGVEGQEITALLFKNSAMDYHFGDVEAFVYPQKPLYGVDVESKDAIEAKELVSLLEQAFRPSQDPKDND